jgi:methylphosphotriester-DNA--protein-cysteine methyltransferase
MGNVLSPTRSGSAAPSLTLIRPCATVKVTSSQSPSSFHEHWRRHLALAAAIPEQLRLIETRRMMLAEGQMIANAAYAVGYESIPQFTREYGRMVDLPPARDLRAAKARMRSAA